MKFSEADSLYLQYLISRIDQGPPFKDLEVWTFPDADLPKKHQQPPITISSEYDLPRSWLSGFGIEFEADTPGSLRGAVFDLLGKIKGGVGGK